MHVYTQMSIHQALRDGSPPTAIRQLLSSGHAQDMEHVTGQMPLHTALLADKAYTCDMLLDILTAYPEAAEIKDRV